MSEPVIKCENVYKIFGANAQKMLQDSNGNVDAKTFQESGCIVGVNNASFEVSKGEMLVVMGLSGSGKSTLLRCISRLTDATGGKIFIEGQDLLQLNNWVNNLLAVFEFTEWRYLIQSRPSCKIG